MPSAPGRHPMLPAHIHFIVGAPFRPGHHARICGRRRVSRVRRSLRREGQPGRAICPQRRPAEARRLGLGNPRARIFLGAIEPRRLKQGRRPDDARSVGSSGVAINAGAQPQPSPALTTLAPLMAAAGRTELTRVSLCRQPGYTKITRRGARAEWLVTSRRPKIMVPGGGVHQPR